MLNESTPLTLEETMKLLGAEKSNLIIHGPAVFFISMFYNTIEKQ